MGVPGTALVLPSVLVTDSSASGVSSVVSLPLVGGSPGGVAVAMLVSAPVAVGLISTVKLKVTVASTGTLMVVSRASVPLVGPVTLPPPVSLTNDQLAPVTPAGSGSDRVTPVALLGPALLTVMV